MYNPRDGTTIVRYLARPLICFKYPSTLDFRALLFVSTQFSATRGGTPLRTLSIQMRADVKSTTPIEPDRFQGWGDLPNDGGSPPGIAPTLLGQDECMLSWWGHKMPLQLAGGSAQLVTYTRLGRRSAEHINSLRTVGRAPPRALHEAHPFEERGE